MRLREPYSWLSVSSVRSRGNRDEEGHLLFDITGALRLGCIGGFLRPAARQAGRRAHCSGLGYQHHHDPGCRCLGWSGIRDCGFRRQCRRSDGQHLALHFFYLHIDHRYDFVISWCSQKTGGESRRFFDSGAVRKRRGGRNSARGKTCSCVGCIHCGLIEPSKRPSISGSLYVLVGRQRIQRHALHLFTNVPSITLVVLPAETKTSYSTKA